MSYVPPRGHIDKKAETLMEMTEVNITSVQDKIKKIMKDRIELKRKFKRKISK